MDATTLEPCQIKFVEGEDVLKLLQDNSQLALTAARILGHEIGMAFRDVHDLMMARSSTEKLAQLLISWVANEPDTPEPRVASDFTHEEKRR